SRHFLLRLVDLTAALADQIFCGAEVVDVDVVGDAGRHLLVGRERKDPADAVDHRVAGHGLVELPVENAPIKRLQALGVSGRPLHVLNYILWHHFLQLAKLRGHLLYTNDEPAFPATAYPTG